MSSGCNLVACGCEPSQQLTEQWNKQTETATTSSFRTHKQQED
jgi:hypothetical protein